ncbi:unnamed protein product [Mesocestoides corti]|uniref:Uncharacterized protein n=1 Tax=Mesocestoides corti TaxID=53468 RepID=A0A0R3UCV8_MESCO|nr:unnamed protein product [Mesocestoides corti]
MVGFWISSIPPDASTDEQTSPTEIESILKELFISDDTPSQSDTIIPSTSGGRGGGDGGEISEGRAERDHNVQQQQVLQTQGGCASGGGGDGDADVADQGNTTTALSGSRLSPQPTPGAGNHQSPASPLSSSSSSSMEGPRNRVFDDLETLLVVQMFKDLLVKGKCPSMREVRRRTTNSVLLDGRTVKSIWKEVKRLLLSGRWIKYAY